MPSSAAHNARQRLTAAADLAPGSPEHTALVNEAAAYAALAQASALEALTDRTESIAMQLVELREDLAHK